MFTQKELDLLMQGLAAIEKAESMSDMMGDFLTMTMAKDEEQAQKIKQERELRQRQHAMEKREKTLLVTILKGKLAQLAIEQHESAPFGCVDVVTHSP